MIFRFALLKRIFLGVLTLNVTTRFLCYKILRKRGHGKYN